MRVIIAAFLLAVFSRLHGGEIFAAYFEDQSNKTNTPLAAGDLAITNSVTEIGIEHTACFGTCPIYTFIIRSDGTCGYNGEQYAKLSGRLTGKITTSDFVRLVDAMKSCHYVTLRDFYDASVTDLPTVFTMVKANGKRKVIRDYAASGPENLQSFENLIDGLITKVQWDKPQTAN